VIATHFEPVKGHKEIQAVFTLRNEIRNDSPILPVAELNQLVAKATGLSC
jgi:hypothetical protein